MEWQHNFELLLDALRWWQMALVLVARILIGILIGISIVYLIARFVDKNQVTFFKFFCVVFSKKPEVFTSSDLTRQFINTPSVPPEVHEPANFPISESTVLYYPVAFPPLAFC
jgi:hypothetical protein